MNWSKPKLNDEKDTKTPLKRKSKKSGGKKEKKTSPPQTRMSLYIFEIKKNHINIH